MKAVEDPRTGQRTRPLRNGRVVVVGSLHYDIFVEAPHRPAAGETVTGRRWYPKFGGKGGNQAVAIAGSGCEVRLVSAVGDDGFADFLLNRLVNAKIDITRVSRVAGAGTGMSVAISDSEGDYGAVIVSGANLCIDHRVLGDDDLWAGAAYLALQNEIPEELNVAAANAARARGLRVCLNAAPWRELGAELPACVDLLVVNALEAESLCGRAVDGLEAAEAAAVDLAGRFPSVVVTAGGAGSAFSENHESGAVPAATVDVVSTHGAGDRFTGTLVARLAAGAGLGASVRHANRAAARHVATRRDE